MSFLKAFKIFFKNYLLVLKVVLAQAIMIVAGVGILALSTSGIVSDLGAQLVASGLPEAANNILHEVVSADYTAQKMMFLVNELIARFQEWGMTIEWFYYKLSLYSVIFLVWLIAVRFTSGLGSLPLNQNLNEYLGSSYKSPFFWQYFRNIGKSSIQQLWSLIFEFLADIFVLFATVGVYVVVFVYTGIWGLVATALVFSVLISFRRAATAFWLPEAVNNPDVKIRLSFKKGLQAVVPVFGRLFLKVFIVFTVTLAVILGILLLFSFNLLALTFCMIIFAHSNVFLAHLSMAEYYKATQKDFYVTRT